MGEPPQIYDLLVSLALLGIELLTFVFFLVMTILSFRLFRKTWRRGLIMGLAVLALSLPSTILSASYFDISEIARTLPPEMVPILHILIGMLSVVFLMALVPLRMAYFHVASVEWKRIRPLGGLAGPPETRGRGVAIGAVTGVVATLLTFAVFYQFNVHESDSIVQFEKMFPGMNSEISVSWVACMLGFVIAAAIVEEFVFRGGILGFLLRITGNGTALAWLFITLVAFVWALLHLLNTDHPLIKISQIFLLGLAFGGMARRWGIGSAISGHVSLNASAVVFALAFPGDH